MINLLKIDFVIKTNHKKSRRFDLYEVIFKYDQEIKKYNVNMFLTVTNSKTCHERLNAIKICRTSDKNVYEVRKKGT